jgi:hypothetical protein
VANGRLENIELIGNNRSLDHVFAQAPGRS